MADDKIFQDTTQEFGFKRQIPALIGLSELSIKYHGFRKDKQEYLFDAIKYLNKYFAEITDIAIYMPPSEDSGFEMVVDRISNRKLAGTPLFKQTDGYPWEVYLSGMGKNLLDLANNPEFEDAESLANENGSYYCVSIEQSSYKRLASIAFYSSNPFFFNEQVCIILGKFCMALGAALESYQVMKEAVEKSLKDELTGVYNRRYFNEHYESEVYRHRRYHSPYGILMLDIDHFKSLNDTYGHAAGDIVLKLVAKSIEVSTRKSDTVARYGGEEFIVFLPDTEKKNLKIVAEKIRLGIENMTTKYSDMLNFLNRKVTTSIGVAAYPDDKEDMKELVVFADANLYKAKALGRNKVVMSGDPDS